MKRTPLSNIKYCISVQLFNTIFIGNRGREFLVLFMKNIISVNGPLIVNVASDSAVRVNISSSAALDANIRSAVDKRLNSTLDPEIRLPRSLTCQYGAVEPKAIIIQTSEPSTITIANNNHKFSSDETLKNSNVVCYSCFDWTKAKFKGNLHFNKSLNIHTHLKSVTILNYHTPSIYYSYRP
jgi:hypothetical protein